MRSAKSSNKKQGSGKRLTRKSSRKNALQAQRINFEQLETRQMMSVVNVTDFGARANDGANDLGAVQAALNASKPGDTILFSGGTFNFSDSMTVPGDRTYKGTGGATLRGRGSEGNLITLHSNNATFTGLTFDGGGIFLDSPNGFNQNITIDSNTFKLNTSGDHSNAITFTSGLQNSRISNNLMTGYSGGFGIYGYNYNTLTIANNEFVNVQAGMHIDAFSNSGNLLVEQNYITGAHGMGMEFQSTASNLTFQDNWYENPSLSTNFNSNNNSMAYSLILDKSSNITIRRNVVIAPQRPDGVGTRIGFEVGGDNTLVEDNYINGVNHVLAVNDGVGSASVTVRNNKFMNYLQGWSNSFPASNRTWQNINNGSNVQLSNTMEARIAANAKPGVGSKRYGFVVPSAPVSDPGVPLPSPSVPPSATPPVATTPAPSKPAAPSGLAAIVTGSNTVNLFWTDRSYNESGYKVEQSTDGQTWTKVAQLKADAASCTIKNLTPGKNYTFRVCSFSAGGNSGYSNSTSVTPTALNAGNTAYLSDITWTSSTNYWGPAEPDRSNGEQAAEDGKQISIAGKKFAKGVGVHAGSEIHVNLDEKYSKFVSTIGLDDESAGQGSVQFEVWADGVKLYSSGVVTAASGRKNISIDVTGKKQMTLIVTNGGDDNDFDHADWGDALLTPFVPAAPLPPPIVAPASTLPEVNDPNAETVYVSDLDWDSYTNGLGTPELNKSNGTKKAGDGRKITLNGKTYAKGIGAHSTGDIRYNLGGKFSTFTSDIGIDDEVGAKGTVIFQVFADGVKLYDSGVMKGGSATRKVSVDVQGKQELWLVVLSAGDTRDNDHADWADAKLTLAPSATLPASHYLSDLTPTSQTNGWGPVELDSSVGENQADDGTAIKLNRRVYNKGLGVHSNSKLVYDLNGQYSTFVTDLGLDDEVGEKGSAVFQIYADGQKVYDSGLMTGATRTQTAVINVAGKQQLWLVVNDGGDTTYYDHADWANARLVA